MIEVLVADVRMYHPLAGVKDEEIIAHLNSAKRDFALTSFLSDYDYKEAVCYQTIIYVAPILWAAGMKNFPGYETIYATAKDLDAYIDIWKKRLESVLERGQSQSLNGWGRYGGV